MLVHHADVIRATLVSQSGKRRRDKKAQQDYRDRSSEPIFDRDGYQCRYCGGTDGPFHVDHVLPVSLGGETVLTNLVTACAPCNFRKGASIWEPRPLEPWTVSADGPRLVSGLACDLCGDGTATVIDHHGWRVCVGGCSRDRAS